MKYNIVLASSSQNRQQLLNQLGLFNFRVFPSNFEENLDKSMGALKYVEMTCKGKVDEVLTRLTDWDICIWTDTICEINGRIIEKPTTAQEAKLFLQMFSNTSILVHTYICVASNNGKLESGMETTEVQFDILNSEIIDAYVECEQNWKGKAGGFGIQGVGALLIRRIVGDYSNVVGLPLRLTGELLSRVV